MPGMSQGEGDGPRGEGTQSKRVQCRVTARKRGTYARGSDMIWDGFCHPMGQHEVEFPHAALIFLEPSPSGIRTRDLVLYGSHGS